MSYANMDGVPTQTAGVSELLASDWNTYVRDNFDSIKFGHVVCTSSTRPTGIGEGTMIYETDTNKVLVYNGSSWVEVNDLDNGGAVSDAAKNYAPHSIVTSLPGSPVDGQVIYYQTTAMADLGVVWAFRYRSGSSSSYKWEFIGGPPIYMQPSAEWTVNSTTAYSSETLAIPLTGEYEMTLKHTSWASVVSNFMTLFVVNSTGTTHLASDIIIQDNAISTDDYETGCAVGVKEFSAQTVRFAFTASNTQGRSIRRYLGFRPVRV